MKYKVTLNNRVYEVEVEAGQAMLLDEYEAVAPAAAPEPPPMIPPLVVLFMVPQLPSRMAPLSRNAVIFIFFIPFIFLIGSSFTNANLCI